MTEDMQHFLRCGFEHPWKTNMFPHLEVAIKDIPWGAKLEEKENKKKEEKDEEKEILKNATDGMAESDIHICKEMFYGQCRFSAT